MPEPASANRDPASILVVDDSALNRALLCAQLEPRGHLVTEAEDGLEALEALGKERFDLVLLDVMMPGMDGAEVLKRMKADEELRHIPVVMISALDDLDLIVRCIQDGAEDYLPKPFNPVLLHARVGACIEKKRLRDREVAQAEQIRREKQRADALLYAVIPIGVALSSEPNMPRLLERILLEAKEFCNADAGTLYLRTQDDKLQFMIMRTDTLGIALGGTTGKDVPYPPVRLFDLATGEPNLRYVVTCAAHTGKSVNIPDAYEAEGFDFSGTKRFDQAMGYRSTSFLTVPLANASRRVVGVLQLINARDPSGRIIPFDADVQQMVESLSSMATVALEASVREQQLRAQIEELRIEIDEQQQARQVAEIVETDYFSNLRQKARRLRENRE